MVSSSQKNVTTPCPAQMLLKAVAGKWKPQIFRLLLASGSMRFGRLLRQLPGATKQSLTNALRELEADGLLIKTMIQEKPLHIEYSLSERGASLVSVFEQLEKVAHLS